MTIPFFSIVMPAYNCESTVSVTLDSILAQIWNDYELIIINDGSTDNTLMVLENYAKRDNRIKIISKQNGGPGSARNTGIKNAKGKYLYLMDSDDALPLETLKKFATYLIKDNPDLIVSSYQLNVLDGEDVVDKRIIKADKKWIKSNESFLNNIHELMEKQLMYVIWNKVYKLDIIRKHAIQFPHYSSCEDRLFNLAYYEHVNTCQLSSEVLYYYSFDGKNSLTNKYLPNKFETFEEFYLNLLKLTDKNKDISSALFLKGTMSCIIPLHSQSCYLSMREKRSEIKTILTNKSVIEASRLSAKNTLIRKVMAALFRSKSVTINFIASLLMFYTSQLSPKLIEKLKGNF